jgi:hypothetical protein
MISFSELSLLRITKTISLETLRNLTSNIKRCRFAIDHLWHDLAPDQVARATEGEVWIRSPYPEKAESSSMKVELGLGTKFPLQQ